MVDTVRTWAYLQNVLRDGQPPNSIAPQAIRDLLASVMSQQTQITAAGTNQGTATVLTAFRSVVNTVAANTGVLLTPSMVSIVSNRGANKLACYPQSGNNIEQLAANVAFSLPPGQDATFWVDQTVTTQVYVTWMLNMATLATSLPSAAGIPWLDGQTVAIS